MGTAIKEQACIPKKMRIKIKRADISKWGWAYLMVAPTMIGLFILNIWPIIQTIYFSFCSSGDFGKYEWMGTDNYARMAADVTLWQSTSNTFLFTILSVPLGVCLSLLAAQLLNTSIKGKTIYRTIYFLPIVSAPAAIAMVWKWLYNCDFGLINYILSFFGIDGPGWNTDPGYAMISIAVVAIWSSIGYNMIILLAGLQNIPKTYYEAAEIDGANPFRKYFSITLPLLSPTLFFVIIISVMGALKQFDLVYMMTGFKNPVITQTRTLVHYFYTQAFDISDKGYGSTIIVFLFIIIMFVTWLQFKGQRKWVHYN